MSEQEPEAPGPDSPTDAADVDQDAEPSTNAPEGEGVDESPPETR